MGSLEADDPQGRRELIKPFGRLQRTVVNSPHGARVGQEAATTRETNGRGRQGDDVDRRRPHELEGHHGDAAHC